MTVRTFFTPRNFLIYGGVVLLLAARLLPRTAAFITGRRVSFGDASIGSVFSVLVIALVSSVAITGFASAPL